MDDLDMSRLVSEFQKWKRLKYLKVTWLMTKVVKQRTNSKLIGQHNVIYNDEHSTYQLSRRNVCSWENKKGEIWCTVMFSRRDLYRRSYTIFLFVVCRRTTKTKIVYDLLWRKSHDSALFKLLHLVFIIEYLKWMCNVFEHENL